MVSPRFGVESLWRYRVLLPGYLSFSGGASALHLFCVLPGFHYGFELFCCSWASVVLSRSCCCPGQVGWSWFELVVSDVIFFAFPKLPLVLGQVFCYVVHSLPAFCVFPLLVFVVYYYVCLFFPLFLFLLSRSSSFSPGSSPGNQTNLRNGWLAARVAGWMAAWVGRRLGADLPCQVILLGEV